MKIKKLFLLPFVLLGLMSCSNDAEEAPVSSIFPSHRISVTQAKENVLDFVSHVNARTRTSFKNIKIADVHAVSLSGKATRSTGSSVSLDTLFYVVNFEDSCGFAIAASDDREQSVYALAEEGNYSYNEEDTTNNGFLAFVSALIEQIVYNRSNLDGAVSPPFDPSTPAIGGPGDNDYYTGFLSLPDKFEVMPPLLVTKWHQEKPYNLYCKGYLTGCVATAISQISSFLEEPTHISYSYDNGEHGEATLDWNLINAECKFSGGHPINPAAIEQVARLMRYWGITIDADYETEGTGADTGFAVDKMQEKGFAATDLQPYNIDNVISDLGKGNNIILMRGNARYYHVGLVFRKYVDGHAWVVDGYIDKVKNRVPSKYIHCNWGWGIGRNGYYLSDVLNAEEQPVYNDDATPTTRSENFRYRLKTSTITKQ